MVWCHHLQCGQESAKQWKSFGLRTREILGIFWSKTGSILGLTYLFLEERNSRCSYCPQGLGIICSHLCWVVHLQGRWETPEKQPPAPLPHAAVPCTALLTGWLVWNWFPWPFESHSASMAALTKPLQSGGVVPAPAVGSGVSKAVEKLWGKSRGDFLDFWEQDMLHFGADLSFFEDRDTTCSS